MALAHKLRLTLQLCRAIKNVVRLRSLLFCFARITPLALLTFISGCTVQHTSQVLTTQLADLGLAEQHKHARYANWRLSARTPVAFTLVNQPTELLPRTTQKLNAVLQEEMHQFFPTNIALTTNSLPKSMQHAFDNGYELLFVTKLVRVENRLDSRHELIEGRFYNPEQDSGRDEVSIQLLVFETHHRQLLDVATLTSKAAFFKPHDEIPLDLIEQSIRSFLSELSARNARGY